MATVAREATSQDALSRDSIQRGIFKLDLSGNRTVT